MSLNDEGLWTGVRFPAPTPIEVIMNLQKRLTIASHLARCQQAIQQLRDSKPLEDSEWIFNLFNIDSSQENAGKIIFLLFKDQKDNAEFLLSFSHKIDDRKELSQEDWKFILDGLLTYRTHLLMKSSWMSQCECDL